MKKYFKTAKLLLIIILIFIFIGTSGGSSFLYADIAGYSSSKPLSLALPAYAYGIAENAKGLAPPPVEEVLQTPEPEPEPEITENIQVICVPKTDKIAYLTFDDGPCETGKTLNTIAVLDLLAEYDIKATFFVLGVNAKKYPDIILRQFNEGHEIGNHTYSHVNPATVDDEKLIRQVRTTNTIIKKITGKKPTIFRAPYGSPLTVSQSKGIGMRRLGWDLDTLDWRGTSVEKIIEKVEKACKNGKKRIRILFHDGHSQGLREVIDLLISHGYCFDTLKNYKLKK
ncbi:MAG: polysaccharide deacetylase family protein [Christensenellales bacterium]